MPGRFISTIFLCGSFLLPTLGGAYAASKALSKPMFNGNRLDWCLTWSKDCGKPAADAWCIAQGYQFAIAFAADRRIGSKSPTRLIGTGATCDLTYCDGFRQITCEKTPLIRPVSGERHRAPMALIREAMPLQPVSLTVPLPPAKPAIVVAKTEASSSTTPDTPPARNTDPVETSSVSGSFVLPALAPPPKLFEKPMYNGKRLDWCHSWDTDCGQVAADAFCKTNGFTRAKAFEEDPHIGDAQPTRVIANGAVCDQAVCNGFKAITCAM